jgi:hypothetical protein
MPSLTHSRASSSESGSGSSIASSFNFKPLPALPPPKRESLSSNFADNKSRPVSVAVLEQIDELSVGTFARKNSIETPAHIHLPHLDLAASEDTIGSQSPSIFQHYTPRAGSLTVQERSRTPSPTPGWTPRASNFSMNSDIGDDSLVGPFALEASLARLESLSEAEEEEEEETQYLPQASSSQIMLQIKKDLSNTSSQIFGNPSGTFRDKPDFSSYTWPQSADNSSSSLLGVQSDYIEPGSPLASPVLSTYVLNDVDPTLSLSESTASQGRQSVQVSKLVRNGWRGWRSTSQSATPSSRSSIGQPSITLTEHAEDLAQALAPQALSFRPGSLHVGEISPKPKLSPKFSFGRGTPSPRPESMARSSFDSLPTISQTPPVFGSPMRTSHAVDDKASFRRGHNTSRATSEDHIGLEDSRQWSWQPSPNQDKTPERLSHRTRLHLRKATTNRGPRNFAQSFDTNELQRLRESAGNRPRYEWI